MDQLTEIMRGMAREAAELTKAANQGAWVLQAITEQAFRPRAMDQLHEIPQTTATWRTRSRWVPRGLIEAHLSAKGLTRKEFAAVAGVSKRTVERVLAGEPVSPMNAAAIMRAVH